MFKKSLLITGFTSLLVASSFNIEIKKDSWNLVGTSEDLNVSQLDIQDDEYLWAYKSDGWYVNKNITGINQLGSTLSSNSGFWLKATTDRNITIPDNSLKFIPAVKGWTLYSFDDNFNISDLNESIVNTVWSYDNVWSVWGLSEEQYTTNGFENIDSFNQGKGYWINSSSGFAPGVIKSSSLDSEDIWKIYYPINQSNDLSNFSISVGIVKNEDDGTPDYGTFIYKELSFIDGQISAPNYIYIFGVGDNDCKYDPDKNLYGCSKNFDSADITDIEKSISYSNGMLELNLGYVMKNNSYVSDSSFKQTTTYDITVTFNDETIETIGSIEIK